MPMPPSAEGEPCCPPLADQPLDPDWAGGLARMFKALGDPIRLRILSLVASHDGGECCVCDISPAFEVSQPTISHHLKTLREAGLLDCERRGTWVYYWVIPAALEQLSAVLATDSTDIPAAMIPVASTPVASTPVASTPVASAVASDERTCR